MTVRLSDEQVAIWSAATGTDSRDPQTVMRHVRSLAREVQERRQEGADFMEKWRLVRESQADHDKLDALRPACPTRVGFGAIHVVDDQDCPNCTDGLMPLDQWVKLLLDTLRQVTAHYLDGDLRRAINVVLNMAPKDES